MRESGIYGLEDLISDVDGSQAYRPTEHAVTELAAESWEMQGWHPAREEITWVCEDDLEDDDLDICITREAWAVFYARTRAHCEGCSGECGR